MYTFNSEKKQIDKKYNGEIFDKGKVCWHKCEWEVWKRVDRGKMFWDFSIFTFFDI